MFIINNIYHYGVIITPELNSALWYDVYGRYANDKLVLTVVLSYSVLFRVVLF
jgi:hypothetical protein